MAFTPSSVVVAGNSSGANLVIAFVRYMKQAMPLIGRPLCVVAISLWVHPLEWLKEDYNPTTQINRVYGRRVP